MATYTRERAGGSTGHTTTVRAVVSGVDVAFADLVGLLVKLTLAAIPAMIIVAVVGFVLFALIAGVARALVH